MKQIVVVINKLKHNKEHNITPTSITKKVTDIMEGAYGSSIRGNRSRKFDKVAENRAIYNSMTPDKAIKEITKLEKKMFLHAKDLEFEEAAQVRDEISNLRDYVFK